MQTWEVRVSIRLDLLAWTAATAMMAIPATAIAAVDSFIWFEGEQGNSTDARHKGWFEIKDVSFGVEGPSSIGSAASGSGSGKVKSREFTVRRVTDSASPTFRQAVTSGRHFATVKIEMHKSGGDPNQLVNYVFTNVFISRFDLNGAGDRGPEESITFVYGSMTVHYSSQDGVGQKAPAPTKVVPPPGRSPSPSR